MKVKMLTSGRLSSSPAAGTTKAPTAEMAKAMESSMLITAMRDSRERKSMPRRRSSVLAMTSPLATRKQMQPTTSGAHTSSSSSFAFSTCMVAKVLTLKASASTSCTAAAHQPSELGRAPTRRCVRPRPSISSPSVVAS